MNGRNNISNQKKGKVNNTNIRGVRVSLPTRGKQQQRKRLELQPRASVKSSTGSRRANENARVNNNNKSNLVTSNQIIGSSNVPLSDRFSVLHKYSLSAIKTQRRNEQKVKQAAAQNRVKRQEKFNHRRKGLNQIVLPSSQKKNFKSGKGAVKIVKKPAQQSTKATKTKKNSQVKRSIIKEQKVPTGEDLDMEMDTYWFQAGKGPDPKAAKLDSEMDKYWANKPKDEPKPTSPAKTD
jgi:hypothetical protein